MKVPKNMSEVARRSRGRFVITIKNDRRFRWRMYLSLFFFKLAAWASPFKFDVFVVRPETPDPCATPYDKIRKQCGLPPFDAKRSIVKGEVIEHIEFTTDKEERSSEDGSS